MIKMPTEYGKRHLRNSFPFCVFFIHMSMEIYAYEYSQPIF